MIVQTSHLPAALAVAHTLPYDAAFVDQYQKGRPLPAGRWDRVTMPTLVIHGGKSHPWIRNAAQALTNALPDVEHCTLEGQSHIVKPRAVAPVLIEFLSRADARGDGRPDRTRAAEASPA